MGHRPRNGTEGDEEVQGEVAVGKLSKWNVLKNIRFVDKISTRSSNNVKS